MASADQLKLDPAVVTFNPPFDKSRSNHQMTNSGACRLTTKVKCTHPDKILANPVFAVIQPGQNGKLTMHGRFKEPLDAKRAYRVYVQFAEAPAGMGTGDDQQKIRAGWAGIKDPKTVKLNVEFKAEAAPPAAEPAAAAPAEPEQAPPAAEGAPPAE